MTMRNRHLYFCTSVPLPMLMIPVLHPPPSVFCRSTPSHKSKTTSFVTNNGNGNHCELGQAGR